MVALTEKGVSPVEVSSGGAEEGAGETGRVRSQGAFSEELRPTQNFGE